MALPWLVKQTYQALPDGLLHLYIHGTMLAVAFTPYFYVSIIWRKSNFEARLCATQIYYYPTPRAMQFAFPHRPLPTIKAATCVLLLGGFSSLFLGCSSAVDKNIDPPAVELRPKTSALATEAPEGELANLSKRLYQASMYTVARDSLNSLKDRYPLGAYATLSELKYADSFYFNGEFAEAALQYEGFIRNHPGSAEAAYAKLQAARSQAHAAKSDGRDRIPWKRALTLYDELIQNHFNSPLAQTARAERKAVVNELQAYDREIIAFYKKVGNQQAVEARRKLFTKSWASRANSNNKESQRPGFTLRENLPTRTLPSPSPVWTPTRVNETSSTLESSNEAGTPSVQQISCSLTPAPYLVIELSELPPTLGSLRVTEQVVSRHNDKLRLDVLQVSSDTKAWNCLATNDVILGDDGVLEFDHPGTFVMMAIDHPPRLLVSSK